MAIYWLKKVENIFFVIRAFSIEFKKSYILSKIIIFWHILAFENDSLYTGLKTVNTRSTRSALADKHDFKRFQVSSLKDGGKAQKFLGSYVANT